MVSNYHVAWPWLAARMGGPNTRAAQAMALVVAYITREQVFSFWPIEQPNTSSLGSHAAGQQLPSVSLM